MPKNKLFKCLNHFFTNYSFSNFLHFIFQKNAFNLHLEITLLNLFSAHNLDTQKTPLRPLLLQS